MIWTDSKKSFFENFKTINREGDLLLDLLKDARQVKKKTIILEDISLNY